MFFLCRCWRRSLWLLLPGYRLTTAEVRYTIQLNFVLRSRKIIKFGHFTITSSYHYAEEAVIAWVTAGAALQRWKKINNRIDSVTLVVTFKVTVWPKRSVGGGAPKKTKNKIKSSVRESLEVIIRNIQKAKKISLGDPLLRFSHLPVQRLWRKLQGCLFFLLRHVWLEHAFRLEKSVTEGL